MLNLVSKPHVTLFIGVLVTSTLLQGCFCCYRDVVFVCGNVMLVDFVIERLSSVLSLLLFSLLLLFLDAPRSIRGCVYIACTHIGSKVCWNGLSTASQGIFETLFRSKRIMTHSIGYAMDRDKSPNQGSLSQGLPSQGPLSQGLPNQGLPSLGLPNQGPPNPGSSI